MALPVIFSSRADRQLIRLEEYLARSAAPDVAEAYVTRIVARCIELGELPKRGRSRPELGRRLRSIPFERRATILYNVKVDRIEIAAVIYGGQDLKRGLRRR